MAFAVSFGMGSKDVLANILSSFYSKGNFQPGLKIKISGLEGTIDSIDSVSCVIKTATGKVIIPVKRLLQEEVTVLEGAV